MTQEQAAPLCILSAFLYFKFYSSILDGALEIIPSDSQSPAALRILPAQEQLDPLHVPMGLKCTDYFTGEGGRGAMHCAFLLSLST